jgi:tetratricopeptide (TPR) repeat protein
MVFGHAGTELWSRADWSLVGMIDPYLLMAATWRARFGRSRPIGVGSPSSEVRLECAAGPERKGEQRAAPDDGLGRRGNLTVGDAPARDAHAWDDPDSAFNLGILLAQQGSVGEAMDAFRRADELGDGAAASNLGVLLQERGDIAGAEVAYRRADERGDVLGAFNLGTLLADQGRIEEAVDAFRGGDELGDGAAASNLGVLLEERGDVAGAEAAYRRADERGDAVGALNLGNLLARQGKVGAAEALRRAEERGDVAAASQSAVPPPEQGAVRAEPADDPTFVRSPNGPVHRAFAATATRLLVACFALLILAGGIAIAAALSRSPRQPHHRQARAVTRASSTSASATFAAGISQFPARPVDLRSAHRRNPVRATTIHRRAPRVAAQAVPQTPPQPVTSALGPSGGGETGGPTMTNGQSSGPGGGNETPVTSAAPTSNEVPSGGPGVGGAPAPAGGVPAPAGGSDNQSGVRTGSGSGGGANSGSSSGNSSPAAASGTGMVGGSGGNGTGTITGGG